MSEKKRGSAGVLCEQLNSRVEWDEQVEGDGVCVVHAPQEVCMSE